MKYLYFFSLILLWSISGIAQLKYEYRIVKDSLVGGDSFGTDLLITDNFILVSAPLDDEIGKNAGAIYIFKNDGMSFPLTSKLTDPFGGVEERFHGPVYYRNDTIYCHASRKTFRNKRISALVLFKINNSQFEYLTTIYPFDYEEDIWFSGFGSCVDIQDNWMLIGAELTNTHNPGTGAAYFYYLEKDGWIGKQRVAHPELDESDHFGKDVLLHEKMAFITSPEFTQSGMSYAGCVFLYVLDSVTGSWIFKQKILSPEIKEHGFFGGAIAIQDSFLFISEPGNIFATFPGAVYVYKIDPLQKDIYFDQKIFINENYGNGFGISLAVQDSLLAINAYSDSEFYNENGAVYIYRLRNGKWEYSQKIISQDVSDYSNFGSRLFWYKGMLLTGSPRMIWNGIQSGMAHLFTETPLSSKEPESFFSNDPVLITTYPNPFNSSTTFSIHLPEPNRISLNIYDINGKLILTITEGTILSEGIHQFKWNGLNQSGNPVGSGIYFYRLSGKELQKVGKIILIK